MNKQRNGTTQPPIKATKNYEVQYISTRSDRRAQQCDNIANY